MPLDEAEAGQVRHPRQGGRAADAKAFVAEARHGRQRARMKAVVAQVRCRVGLHEVGDAEAFQGRPGDLFALGEGRNSRVLPSDA